MYGNNQSLIFWGGGEWAPDSTPLDPPLACKKSSKKLGKCVCKKSSQELGKYVCKKRSK